MSDELSPENIIVIPRLDAASAAAVGAALQTEAAQVEKLPASVARALTPLSRASGTLHEVLRGRLSVAALSTLPPRIADTDVDNRMGAFYDWVRALSRLSARHPERERARLWLSELFPSGVKFLKYPYAKEWTEIETRITQIKAKGYDKEIQAFGGKPFLIDLYDAHKAYGESLGITAPRAEAAETSAVREAMQAQFQAMRLYVLRVLASVEPDEPETAALASRLLRPLTEWKSRPTKSAESPATEPESASAQP